MPHDVPDVSTMFGARYVAYSVDRGLLEPLW